MIQAGTQRAKPIVLTGLAAMPGAFFILDDPIFNGLAISLIFGIFVSTLLTLIVIPVLYHAANYSKAESLPKELQEPVINQLLMHSRRLRDITLVADPL